MSTGLPQIKNLEKLFLENTPMLDVRAPIEFAKGAVPNAFNIALLNDAERAAVGTCYKQQGKATAVELGHKLVSGEIKEKRLRLWSRFVKNNPQGALYCFRGGMRSKIVQSWIYEHTGIKYPRISGGYKNLRRFLLEEMTSILASANVVVIGGRTGCGKTKIIKNIGFAIDLEYLAKHKGSAFGNMLEPQPAQIDFENLLATELIKLNARGYKTILLEDEGGNIGKIALPQILNTKIKTSPIILLESATKDRIEAILQEYVIDIDTTFLDYLFTSIGKIKKRLGGQRYKTVKSLMQDALDKQKSSGEYSEHKVWIEYLLREYYDPMYDYQIQGKQNRVIFVGDEAQVLAKIKSI